MGLSIMLLSSLFFYVWCPFQVAQAVYVDYNKARSYAKGETIPLLFNKLTSPSSLASMDFGLLPTCPIATDETQQQQQQQPPSLGRWDRAINSWHGDFFHPGPDYQIEMLQDLYCQQLCWMNLRGSSAQTWQEAIARDMHYNFQVDNMPVAYRQEDRFHVSTRYWGGVPIGQVGGKTPDDPRFRGKTNLEAFVLNHVNIEILYAQDDNSDSYRIVETIVQPFSILHEFEDAAQGVTLTDPPLSCLEGATEHTNYQDIFEWDPQPAAGRVLFTYDVIWRPATGEDPSDKRWDVFLTMDDSVPIGFQLAGLVLAIVLNLIFYIALVVCVMRDLSYKPMYAHDETASMMDLPEEAHHEMDLWPLSTQIFIPPRHSAFLLCSLVGTGAHLLLAGLLFIMFYRMGVINQSVGADIITAGVIIYLITSVVGGFVTGRMCAVFHASVKKALWTTAATAVAYPLLGIVVIGFVYGVFPDSQAPNYNAISNGIPIILVWLWLMIPSVLGFGYIGHWRGGLSNFPVSESAEGYQDVHLQLEEDSEESTACDKCWRKWRTPTLLVFAGIPPTLCCFIPFSYGIAGPVFLGYFSSTKIISIAPFVLFVTCAAGVSGLLYYRQIRAYNYHWWWPAFISGGSCGLHIFILALSWLFFNISEGEVEAGTFVAYSFWFAYVALGVFCMCGAAGVALCIFLTQFLYFYMSVEVDADSDNKDLKSPETKGTDPTEFSPSSLSRVPEDMQGQQENDRQEEEEDYYDDELEQEEYSDEEDLVYTRAPPKRSQHFYPDHGIEEEKSSKAFSDGEEDPPSDGLFRGQRNRWTSPNRGSPYRGPPISPARHSLGSSVCIPDDEEGAPDDLVILQEPSRLTPPRLQRKVKKKR